MNTIVIENNKIKIPSKDGIDINSIKNFIFTLLKIKTSSLNIVMD